jgi:hypothetical protein
MAEVLTRGVTGGHDRVYVGERSGNIRSMQQIVEPAVSLRIAKRDRVVKCHDALEVAQRAAERKRANPNGIVNERQIVLSSNQEHFDCAEGHERW